MIRHRRPEPAPPARVVILGSSGFVGSHLARHLAGQGVATVGLSSRDADLGRPESVDRLRGLVRPGDALVFISALTPDKGRDVRTLMRNLAMGEHVAAALEGAAPDHLVYISSDAVYEDAANPVRESSCCDPSTFHGLMHLARERMLAPAAQKAGCPLLILRPAAVYGAGDTHNSYGPNRFARTALAEGRITLFGQGEERRDHLYVEDLARLIGLGLGHRSAGVLNVATGRAASFGDVARLVAELCGREVRVEGQPRATPITHRHFDVAAALRAFPKFHPTAIRDGLAATLQRMAATPGGRG
jgi:UDP-glucose 4-epimerase